MPLSAGGTSSDRASGAAGGVPAVVVTGAAGFIGSHLCRALAARGSRVVGIDNFDPFYDRALKERNVRALESSRVQFVDADVRDPVAMSEVLTRARPAAIFHMAALAGVRPSIADPARYTSVNVDGLVTMLEASRRAECRHFIFASSSSVYGNNSKVPFAEDDPVDHPISPYAATKRAGELIGHTYAHLFGLRFAALRFFTVFGPAQRPDLAIAKFMRKITLGEDVPMFGDGSMSRDYTFIDDVIAGCLAAYDRLTAPDAPSYRIWNLGGSSPVTLTEMIRQIGNVVGREPRVRQLPSQPGDVERTFADLTRSRAELGYEPRTPFIDGLKRQWEWVQRMHDM